MNINTLMMICEGGDTYILCLPLITNQIDTLRVANGKTDEREAEPNRDVTRTYDNFSPRARPMMSHSLVLSH